ncbi:LysM peptidoglycan-binding domain-containing protein [Anaerocolumna sp. AGMB13025]|uniref:LysM peptidoglycan-binding domain-containing protein n=1 Tax=Anaerocolumna sp. AGMB13025 TaxID=3039116 RepID=UPI00241FBFC0|nr:LysM peptidoglycan-binding domain-containing protein [Anaerocolumna sp. AGMB13025]WFR58868.1 LysM peptidoglycan-binding domain-containing protein [Anaerocolumna sp. AGMB13025]
MIIHVVEPGETILSIADYYGVSAEKLKIYNNFTEEDTLVIGEALIILIPEITYTVKEGDTLAQIADAFGTTVIELLRYNPELSDRQSIYAGDEIVISFRGEKEHTIATNGYAYPFIDTKTLQMTLPYLTYLTVYSYTVSASGDLNNLEDEDIIKLAKAYGTEPIMMIIPAAPNNSNEDAMEVVDSIISDITIEDRFIDQILHILDTKGYSGVSFHTPYIHPRYRDQYRRHAAKMLDRITSAGYKVMDTFENPIMGFDYKFMTCGLSGITLIVYEFGYSDRLSLGTLCTENYQRIISDFTQMVPSDMVSFGLPMQGYIYQLPFIPGSSQGRAISYKAALELAAQYNAQITYDPLTNSISFYYYSGDEYLVRFWDARSYEVFLKLVPEFNLYGVGIWNIMQWYPQLWMSAAVQYSII